MKKTRSKIKLAAAKANGYSRACEKCPLRCRDIEVCKACSMAFIEGFKKGVKWQRKEARNIE